MQLMETAAALDWEIAAAEAEVARLEGLRAEALRGLERLQAERARLGSSSGPSAGSGGWSAERKLEVFAGLFRGREDVFALRWENAARGRSGWAPRCANEWKRGVCEKPRVRCGECHRQAFVARTRCRGAGLGT
jgi:hypothetical protein